MPVYEYICTVCGHPVEVIHSFTAQGPTSCERCGSAMRKALSTPAIVFKGSGWAKKDHRDKVHASASAAAKPAASGGDGAASDGAAAGGDRVASDGEGPATGDSRATGDSAATSGSPAASAQDTATKPADAASTATSRSTPAAASQGSSAAGTATRTEPSRSQAKRAD